MGYTPGTYILGPSHSLRVVPNSNSLGLPNPIIFDGDRTKFTSKFEDELVKNDSIDNGARVVATRIPGGISGSIEFEKAGKDFSQVMILLDSGYFSGQPKADFTMTETIVLADGSLEQNKFIGTVFHDYDKGAFERKNTVKVSVSFFATQVL